jgi:hypothetical protein
MEQVMGDYFLCIFYLTHFQLFLSSVETTAPPLYALLYGGLLSQGSFYIDPFYVPMDPIFCINKTNIAFNLSADSINGPEICFLLNPVGQSQTPPFVYPVMSQYTFNMNDMNWQWKRKQCTCPLMANDFKCNFRDYYYTLIQSSSAATASSTSIIDLGIRMQNYMIIDPENGDKLMSYYFANLTSHSITESGYFGAQSPQSIKGIDGSQPNATLGTLLQNEWDVICPAQDCSAVIFESYADPGKTLSLAVNPYNVQFEELTNVTFDGANYLNVPFPIMLPRLMWYVRTYFCLPIKEF